MELLPRKNVYKANLHCHSNLSDGKLTPEELVQMYHDLGYSVLAITDHEFCIDHSDLNRPDFLTLTGYEYQIVDPERPRRPGTKCCHICLLSKDPHEFKHIAFNPEAYDFKRLCHADEEQRQKFRYTGDGTVLKYYDTEFINEVVKEANENGWIVAYNHPTWSLEDWPTYSKITGFYAMEIYNSDCYMLGLEEYNSRVYDTMLRSGCRLGAIATDDCHYGHPLEDPRCDMGTGWTNICADTLAYDDIWQALKKGDFYASTGPEIRRIAYEDGKIKVETSDAVRIALTTGTRRADCVMAARTGAQKKAGCPTVVNAAEFSVRPEDKYVRITVKDAAGCCAFSRAYFLDEMQ